jgi:hypothetical protein
VKDQEAESLYRNLSQSDLMYRKDPDMTIEGLLQEWARDPKSIKALRLLQERQRHYSRGGAESPTETSLRGDDI